jgi:type IV secretion system protein VirB1
MTTPSLAPSVAPTLSALVLSCAPLIAPDTALAVVRVESGGNPWAIGVVGNALVRQPRNRSEALATARRLDQLGWDYSVGLGQINRRNFARLGLTVDTVFDPCTNLRAMQTLLGDCFNRAPQRARRNDQQALRQAFSCYYSGNFSVGFRRDLPGQPAYVDRVIAAWQQNQAGANRNRGSPAIPPRPG